MLIKYIKSEEGKPVGCVVSTGRKTLGWSLTSTHDKFCKSIAKKIAIGRLTKEMKRGSETEFDAEYWVDRILTSSDAYFGKNPNPYMGRLIQTLYEQDERSQRYFQEEED